MECLAAFSSQHSQLCVRATSSAKNCIGLAPAASALLGCSDASHRLFGAHQRVAVRPVQRGNGITKAFWGTGADNSPELEPEPVISEKRRLLLSYVQEVEPAIVDKFLEIAPDQVVDAMNQAVSNLVGTLPPAFFNVTINTHGENLGQLMFSVLMTGYLFRNAQYRLELTQSLALPAGASDASGTSYFPHADNTAYAPGTQKTRVSGDVILWNNMQGPQSVPAAEYIESLEEELRLLRQQLQQQKTAIQQTQNVEAGRNSLLDYLKGLDPETLEELTACCDEDSQEAMNTFIHRVLGTQDNEELRRITSQSSAAELSHTLFYLMVVGFLLRTLEVRFNLQSSMDSDGSEPDDGLPGLLAGW